MSLVLLLVWKLFPALKTLLIIQIVQYFQKLTLAQSQEYGFYALIFVLWVINFIVGYLNWFKFIPYFRKKIEIYRKKEVGP